MLVLQGLKATRAPWEPLESKESRGLLVHREMLAGEAREAREAQRDQRELKAKREIKAREVMLVHRVNVEKRGNLECRETEGLLEMRAM